MHTRRISTFLLGAWILGCALMAYISVQALTTSASLASPVPAVTEIEQKLGYDLTAMLVRHVQQDQARAILRFWERGEILLGIALGGCLFMATQRKIFPLVICGLMVMLAMFQFFALSPEIAYRGREADLPPGNNNVATMTRLIALQQVYFGVEIVKLMAGGLLASYLFVFRTSRRSRKERDLIHSED
jgi:hypothetical protein